MTTALWDYVLDTNETSKLISQALGFSYNTGLSWLNVPPQENAQEGVGCVPETTEFREDIIPLSIWEGQWVEALEVADF